MPWLEPAIATVKVAGLVNQLAQSSWWIRKHANRVQYWIEHGSAIIPIFGAGGVGKSTTAKIVAGGDPLDIATAYQESWLIETVKLTADVPGRLLVAPGQGERVVRHWPELFASIKDGTAFGVLNVVAYGYHSLAIQSFKEHDLYQAGMDEGAFMAAYLPNRRDVEIDRLKILLECLAAANRPLWMLTLVTKQDLWWGNRAPVREYYEKGEYGKLIKEAMDGGKLKNFQHEFLPVSLAVGNLKTPNGATLAQTTAGYETVIHVAHLQTMFSRLYDLVAQGALK